MLTLFVKPIYVPLYYKWLVRSEKEYAVAKRLINKWNRVRASMPGCTPCVDLEQVRTANAYLLSGKGEKSIWSFGIVHPPSPPAAKDVLACAYAVPLRPFLPDKDN
jgi:hypothetical protein